MGQSDEAVMNGGVRRIRFPFDRGMGWAPLERLIDILRRGTVESRGREMVIRGADGHRYVVRSTRGGLVITRQDSPRN